MLLRPFDLSDDLWYDVHLELGLTAELGRELDAVFDTKGILPAAKAVDLGLLDNENPADELCSQTRSFLEEQLMTVTKVMRIPINL